MAGSRRSRSPQKFYGPVARPERYLHTERTRRVYLAVPAKVGVGPVAKSQVWELTWVFAFCSLNRIRASADAQNARHSFRGYVITGLWIFSPAYSSSGYLPGEK